ncbi:pyrroline-5-carboxylate reductase [Bacillus sp. FJAT-45066]|uniref:pyrroline-5-carboxylate reductase n=1 Tax=Bacillus sp. FJAT-45066 TaxID=2011010 RepID=UPI0020D03775|nr:pyrroline-5-carboxylate reductase [Bacillus sp. FJAT-45066]
MKVAFIGAGNMAEAIISGLLKKEISKPCDIMVTNKQDDHRLELLENTYGVVVSRNLEVILENADVVFLAMKPKDAKEAIQSISKYITTNMLVVSVLAGISTSMIEGLLVTGARVIRTMPNTSAAVGLSATAIAAGSNVSERDLATAQHIFSSIGVCTVVEEEQIHAVTGLSGSGPAYFYYMVESLQNAAVKEGLGVDVAKMLIRQTILGAAQMLAVSEKDAAQLRLDVTSPGGTTEAGIRVLEQYATSIALEACLHSAAERSRELGAMLE